MRHLFATTKTAPGHDRPRLPDQAIGGTGFPWSQLREGFANFRSIRSTPVGCIVPWCLSIRLDLGELGPLARGVREERVRQNPFGGSA
jgi:hypothetical protein